MGIQCRAPGCVSTHAKGRWAIYCERHQCAKRRHGDPLANAFTRTELTRYRAAVRAKRKATKEAPFWAEVDKAWFEFVTLAGAWGQTPGVAYHWPTRKAGEEFRKIAGEAEAAVAIEVIAGMWLAQLQDPARFVSDDHFRFETVRRLRSLGAPCNAMRWDGRHNRTRRLYHDLNPKVVLAMFEGIAARPLMGACVHIAQTIMEDERRARVKRDKFRASFAGIETAEDVG